MPESTYLINTSVSCNCNFLVFWLNLLTFLDARKRKSELSNEIVPGRLVVVLHHEAHQGQLRGVDDKI